MVLADSLGFFGDFGGKYIPEVLQSVFDEVEASFKSIQNDKAFWDEFSFLMKTYSCRPTPITYAENISRHFGGPKFFIKREDLNHTGAHKFNNVLGQGLLAKRMGKTRLIAETGAGQHGLATATIAAKLGMKCTIYMGATDIARQRPNVFWMQKLGAEVVSVESGHKTLKDAINEAFKDWVSNVSGTHYLFGTACGPHPFPEMVARFQKIIGDEARLQMTEIHKCLPTAVYACVGGGSNALGVFQGFLEDEHIKLVGVEAGGKGIDSGLHAVRLAGGDASIGIAQGYKTYFIQNRDGQMLDTHSISAGLDYVGVSPILSYYRENKRIEFASATDAEVMQAHELTMRLEGIIPALESTHAFAQAYKDVARYSKDDVILINQSGRGDKDIFTIAEAYNDASWKEFITGKAEQYKG